jgi:hypothetical protein
MLQPVATTLHQHTRDVNRVSNTYLGPECRPALLLLSRGTASRVMSWSPESTGTATTVQILSHWAPLGASSAHVRRAYQDALQSCKHNTAETALDATSNTLLEHIDAGLDRSPSTAQTP